MSVICLIVDKSLTGVSTDITHTWRGFAVNRRHCRRGVPLPSFLEITLSLILGEGVPRLQCLQIIFLSIFYFFSSYISSSYRDFLKSNNRRQRCLRFVYGYLRFISSQGNSNK